MTVNSRTARFRYRAADADGTAVRGEIEADSARDAVDTLRRRALWVIELHPLTNSSHDRLHASNGVEGATSASTNAFASPWRVRVSRLWRSADTELAAEVRAIATLLNAGVPLYRALSYAVTHAPDPLLRVAFTAIRDAVEGGSSLSSALSARGEFPRALAPLVAAGEASGTLGASLSLIADHLERRDLLRSKLRSALIYPTILGAASTVGIVVILLLVVPRFAGLIAETGGTLPASTRALVAISSVVTHYGWVLLILLVLGAALLQRWLATASARQKYHERRLSWPLVGSLERTRAAASYVGTLAVALRSGVSMLDAMALARAVVSNQQLSAQMLEAESRVRGGARLSDALAGTLPPLAERLLDAGESSGDLAGMAARAADACDAEAQQRVAHAVTLIEPVMILGFGGVVGFVALALLQAIYGLNAQVP